MNLFRLLLIPLLLAACSQPTAAPTPPVAATPVPAVLVTSSPFPEDTYQVEIWVDNPTPAQNEQVVIFGSLIKNGVYLGGPMMATWAGEKAFERGVPNCLVSIAYQQSFCTLNARDFPSGVYVPVKLVIHYNGQDYTGEAGFTPQ